MISLDAAKTSLRNGLKFLRRVRNQATRYEIVLDLEETRRTVGKWAGERADQSQPYRQLGIVSFTNVPIHSKFQCLVGKVAQLEGLTPLVFTQTGSRFAHEYFKLFGITKLVMWNRYSREVLSNGVDVAQIVKAVLPETNRIGDWLSLQYKGVDVGKHALSMTCRKRVEGRLDLNNPAVFALAKNYLGQAIESVLVAEHFFDVCPVEKLLVRDSGYIPNGAIYEVALLRGIDCIVYEQGQKRGTWVLKRHDRKSKGLHYFSISDSTWKAIKEAPWTAEQQQLLDAEFRGRYSPDSTDDTRRLQTGKQVLSEEEVRTLLALDPKKKTAVIFSHLAWDAAFFYGECLFQDFEDWLLRTVEFVARQCPHMNWVVKLHPFNVFKLQRETKTEESEMVLLRPLMPLPEHIKIVRADTPINTYSLFPIVDYVLTVNGTVGMEFPCFGIPAVLAGTGRYNGRGFTIDPRSQDEYFCLLRKLHEVPRLTAEQQLLARKHFLALTSGRQYSFEDVARVELKRLHEAQSDVHDNLVFIAGSLEEFESARSVQHFRRWLMDGELPDLMNPDEKL